MPDEKFTVSVSERKAFRACPQAWWWRYRERLKPAGATAAHFWFGSAVHEALAEWYKPGFRRGVRPVTTFKKWMRNQESELIPAGYDDKGQAQFEDAYELGVSMLTRYVEHYGKDEDLEFLATEQRFEIDILDTDGSYVCTVIGAFDGVFVDHSDGSLYLAEHKTAASISTAFLALDDQAGTYYAVATDTLRVEGILGPGQAIDGVMYNYLRKAKPDLRQKDEGGRYLNKNGTISARQGAPEFHREIIERAPGESNRQLSRLRDEVKIMKGIDRGTIPLVKNTTYQCPKCDFFDLCQLDERGSARAVRALKKSSFVPRESQLRKDAGE